MDIAPVTTSYALDDLSWLASQHGVEAAESITLLKSAFTANTHYPDGFLKSGLPLGKINASGKYGPYNDAASDGTETLVGFLYGGVEVVSGGGANLGGALLTHCKVRESRLPIAVNSNGKADVAGRIRFV
ncbi:MAG: VWBp37 [Frankiales bacterium]|nr:VWBp37 [Frankiales bacterium]